jgi:uncharacterized protein YndB with AHSA1/START domain
MAKPKLNPFQISHEFNAGREFLYTVWTNYKHVKNWMAAPGCSIRFTRCDIRPGRTAHYCLTGSDGKEIWGKVIYRQMIKPKYVEYVQYFSNEAEGIVRHPLISTWPMEILTTINFSEREFKTNVSVNWTPINARPEDIATFNGAHQQMEQGWNGTFLQIDTYLDLLLRPNG